MLFESKMFSFNCGNTCYGDPESIRTVSTFDLLLNQFGLNSLFEIGSRSLFRSLRFCFLIGVRFDFEPS